jgi:hypothetical protein
MKVDSHGTPIAATDTFRRADTAMAGVGRIVAGNSARLR